MTKINLFWFRRDLRLTDNAGLYHAIKSSHVVLPIFIFDANILQELPKDDARISFIHGQLRKIDIELNKQNSALKIYLGKPLDIFKELVQTYQINAVFTNKDYEPYALQRDQAVSSLLKEKNIEFKSFKDQVIFEESEVMKDDGKPYTVFTPYMKKWRSRLNLHPIKNHPIKLVNLLVHQSKFPELDEFGFSKSNLIVRDFQLEQLENYSETRNFPTLDQTSYLSPHLRFGTIGIRELIHQIPENNTTFINELVWREFFMQILFHFPHVVHENFKPKYNNIQWRNNEQEFDKWCKGKTGYPMVDAGMRQLNTTGYMHNRVRMVTAGFLCKHLLIDWKWGEAYFAEKLLDYELSSNNGNWQWASGTGCDAAPYFRIFNPIEQLKRFDPKMEYVKKWVPEINEIHYRPIVDHKAARERALNVYKEGLAVN